MTYSMRSGGVATGYSICPLRGRCSDTTARARSFINYSVLVNRSSLLARFALQTKSRFDSLFAAIESRRDILTDEWAVLESMA